MVLSDREILERLEAGDLVVAPIDDLEVQLQPCSIDLRVGPDFYRPATAASPYDPYTKSGQQFGYSIRIADGETLIIDPGDFYLATTVERVELPVDLMARVDGRSSLARLGVGIHVTAGFIDPGFRGQITLELVNFGPRPVVIHPGKTRICQISFYQLGQPAARPYGTGSRASKYQDQMGPTPSRFEKR